MVAFIREPRRRHDSAKHSAAEKRRAEVFAELIPSDFASFSLKSAEVLKNLLDGFGAAFLKMRVQRLGYNTARGRGIYNMGKQVVDTFGRCSGNTHTREQRSGKRLTCTDNTLRVD